MNYVYRFHFEDGRQQEYEVRLDAETALIQSVELDQYPEWAALEYKKCPHCPLQDSEAAWCPVARNLVSLVEEFSEDVSCDSVFIEVEAEERNYSKKTSLQRGLYSIFGLIMATSGCPHMDFLRPMAMFHLPFLSAREASIRSISFHLVYQYLQVRIQQREQISLDSLERAYQAVQSVNDGIIGRIRCIGRGDAEVNAMILLHTMVRYHQMSIEDVIGKLSPFFLGSEVSSDVDSTAS